mmetsp:Transcript_25478/g.28574  ORF Transcript_25478/g.28574 Transcript_25478/m.28574 type:complete len:205 (+) Transcript_25478:116-730(+)
MMTSSQLIGCHVLCLAFSLCFLILLFSGSCEGLVVVPSVPALISSPSSRLIVGGRHRTTTTLISKRWSYSSSSLTTMTSILFAVEGGAGEGVQTIDLTTIDDDHEKEGQLMADSIIAWLDAEWVPQQVHIEMAECAKQSYIDCRQHKQQHDVMDVMMQISNDLQENWSLYNEDAFINAWDIGNYCSDYLVARSGNEGCACSEVV